MQLTIVRMPEISSPFRQAAIFDRQAAIQVIQHNFSCQVQTLFSNVGSLILSNNSYELFVVSNGLTIEDHAIIYNKLTKFVPSNVEMLIGFDKEPFRANENASASKKRNQFTQYHGIFGKTSNDSTELVSFANIKYEIPNSYKSQYEQSLDIQKIYFKISQFFFQRNALTFNMGNNNFFVLDSQNTQKNTKDFVTYAKDVLGITVHCGIGVAKFGRIAALLANASLDLAEEENIEDIPSEVVIIREDELKIFEI